MCAFACWAIEPALLQGHVAQGTFSLVLLRHQEMSVSQFLLNFHQKL